MRFDFSYIKLVYDIIDRKEDISKLRNHAVYKNIKYHAENTYNDYLTLENSLCSILQGKSNKYGQFF